MWQHVEGGRIRPGVGDADLHQEVVGIGLAVNDLDDPVPVVVEHTRVHQLVLGLTLISPAVLGDQVPVGELGLRIVVAPAQPRVARERVEIPPVLLHVLTVIALWTREAEHPLLQDRIAPVPQRGARQSSWPTSLMPAMPSSPQR